MSNKPDVTKSDVKNAMDQLRSEGQYPSVARIRGLTGGSDSTIARYKRELEEEATPPQDSEEELAAFRSVWCAALQKGAAQQAQAIEDLKRDYASLLSEHERTEGELLAAQTQLEQERRAHSELVAKLHEAQAQAMNARANSESDARKLSEVLAALSSLQQTAATESSQLRSQLSETADKLHGLDLQLATTVGQNEGLKLRVEEAEACRRESERLRSQLSAEISSLNSQLIEARSKNADLGRQLEAATSRISELQQRCKDEIPELRRALAASETRCHAVELQLARAEGLLDRADRSVISDSVETKSAQ